MLYVRKSVCNVNPEKKRHLLRRAPGVNWAKILVKGLRYIYSEEKPEYGLKLKNKNKHTQTTDHSSHFYTEAFSCKPLFREKSALNCLSALSGSKPALIKELLKSYISTNRTEIFPNPIRLQQLQPIRVVLIWPFRIVLLEQSKCKDLEFSFAWGRTNWRPGPYTFVHVRQLHSGSGGSFSFFTKEWRLHFSG